LFIERGIVGPRNREVAVLRQRRFGALRLPARLFLIAKYYDYTAKYLEGGTSLLIPAPLTKKQVGSSDTPCRAFRAIDGCGMARCDFFLERRTGKIYVKRAEYHPRFYVHPVCIQTVGSFRPALYALIDPAYRPRA